MDFEGFFMSGLGCTKAKFLLIQFPKHLGVLFFTQKNSVQGRGTRKKNLTFFLQFVIKKELQTTLIIKITWIA
jgi:hypothetical protein